jgi:hypothetical protein
MARGAIDPVALEGFFKSLLLVSLHIHRAVAMILVSGCASGKFGMSRTSLII